MVHIVTLFERGAHLVADRLGSLSRKHGITQAEGHVLAELARSGPTTIGALHHTFGHKRSTLTNVVDRLEARALVRRRINPNDRRGFVLEMTPSGKAIANDVTKTLDRLDEELRTRLTEEQVAAVAAAVEALAASR
jgi:DNA-binding MarR family transcriptional regulator